MVTLSLTHGTEMDLSKALAYLLRSEKYKHEVKSNEEGYCDLAEVLRVLRREKRFENLTFTDIERIVQDDEKQRFEIVGCKIRVTFGSVTVKE